MTRQRWRRFIPPTFALTVLGTLVSTCNERALYAQHAPEEQESLRIVRELERKVDLQNNRIDVLEQQNRTLKESFAEAAAKEKQEGSIVGSNLRLHGRWNNGPWFETTDKSFKIHVGGRTQFDIVGIAAPDKVMFGQGGTGPFDDAVNFRRARLEMEGTFWDVFNFKCEYDFLNTTQAVGGLTAVKNADGFVVGTTINQTTFNTPAPTDLWVEMTQMPLIGTIRVGNQKPVIGFEHMTSSRWLNFMERSYQFDSFLEDGDNGFTQGISAYNATSDQRATLAAGLYKTNRSVFAWNVGDGEWSGASRVTWLPVWEDEGRSFIHLALGGEYRGLDQDIVRFRSRNMVRNGPASLHNIVAIAQLHAAEGQALLNPEFVVQDGPFLVQAEYIATVIEGVNTILTTPTQVNVKTPNTSYFAQGAYVEILYFLTGEHRDYNKKLPSLGRVVPLENAFWIPGAHSASLFGHGAWQIGARYSWLNLNDDAIRGGEINSLTLGLNWFLNPNCKIQWNYEIARRSVGITTPSAATGDYQGLGVRFAFDF